MELATCPACDGERLATVGKIGHRRIARCTECSHVFASHFDETLLAEANSNEHYTCPADIDRWIAANRRVWTGLCDLVERTTPRVSSLLDVGAGTGGFLLAWHERHPETSLAAIEPSAEAREALGRRLPRLSFPADDASGIEEITHHFDAITLFQVLEHVPDPVRLCQRVHGLLAPDGVLCLTVPNRRSLSARIRGLADSNCYGKPAHLQFFSRSSLECVLRRAGFHRFRRVVQLGGSNVGGPAVFVQWCMRTAGLSSELRYVAVRSAAPSQL
jgi:SAM-dependent methyltransferase